MDKEVLRNLCIHLEAMRDGAGPDIDILLDLNFHAKTEGFLKILRAIAGFDMFWVEIDSYNRGRIFGSSGQARMGHGANRGRATGAPAKRSGGPPQFRAQSVIALDIGE